MVGVLGGFGWWEVVGGDGRCWEVVVVGEPQVGVGSRDGREVREGEGKGRKGGKGEEGNEL